VRFASHVRQLPRDHAKCAMNSQSLSLQNEEKKLNVKNYFSAFLPLQRLVNSYLNKSIFIISCFSLFNVPIVGSVRLRREKLCTANIAEKATFLWENKAWQKFSSKLAVRVEAKQRLSFVVSIDHK